LNLALSSELCPLGGMFTPYDTPRGEHSLLFKIMDFTPRGYLHPLGSISLWGKDRPWGLE
jgi:hypothetical protein